MCSFKKTANHHFNSMIISQMRTFPLGIYLIKNGNNMVSYIIQHFSKPGKDIFNTGIAIGVIPQYIVSLELTVEF